MKEHLASARVELLQEALRSNVLTHISLLLIASLQKAEINSNISISDSSRKEFKTSTMKRVKSIESSWTLSTKQQLQKNMNDLFCSQQKSSTSLKRKTQIVLSSLNALTIDASINWRNANENMQSTQVIVRLKEIKKQKAMKSLHKEVSNKDNNDENQDVSYKKTLVKRLREKAEFTINQLETTMSEQKEIIKHSLSYIRKACNESIKNSIQQQMNALQSQMNKKLETILQIVQQNARNIEKEINSKQMMKKMQISQMKQSLQTTQMKQKSALKLTYAQKTVQSTDANIKTNANAKVSE